MSPVAYQSVALAGTLLCSGVSVIALAFSASVWKKHRHPVDLAYAFTVAAWLLYLLASGGSAFYRTHPLAVLATHAAYQVAIVALSYFLLISASINRLAIHAVWAVQGLVGLLLLVWGIWAPVPLEQHWTYMAWVAMNLVFAWVLCLCIGLNLGRLNRYRHGLVFGASLLSLGICTADLLGLDGRALGVTLAQYFYAAFMLVLWLLMTGRVAPAEVAACSGPAALPSPSWSPVAGPEPASVLVAAAVTSERRRIAQDLHDGIGSQLVNILATLDIHAPQQQAVALALEQCLVDLKIIVDSVESTEGSVLDSLGRLRYRVQHALDKLGIEMVWEVDVEGPLQGFQGERAQQVLRITQECLSNIMRHAHATVVEVTCRHLPDSDSLLLEVCDNGCGIAPKSADQPSGKGLDNLHRRAHILGGELKIATRAQKGTLVRLTVPLQVSTTLELNCEQMDDSVPQ